MDENRDKETKRRHLEWWRRIRKATSSRPQPEDEEDERRSLEEWQDLVEQRIQEAMRRGEFDHLSVQGKPVDRPTNPFADPAQELAHSLMADQGFVPSWIEERKSILRDIETARARLQRAWAWYRRRMAALDAEDEDFEIWQERRQVKARWQQYLDAFRAEVTSINSRIDTYNLTVPLVRFQMFRLRINEELSRLDHPAGNDRRKE